MPRPGRPAKPYRRLTFVLDFDRTFTPDPYLWHVFAERAQKQGHRVLVVSGRNDDEFNRTMLSQALQAAGLTVELILLSHKPKRRALADLGIYPDIWIDDLPETIGATDRQHLSDIYETYPTDETHGPYATAG